MAYQRAVSAAEMSQGTTFHVALGGGALLIGLVAAPLVAAGSCSTARALVAILLLPALTAVAVGVNVFIGAPAGRGTRLLLAGSIGFLALALAALFAWGVSLANCAG